MNMEILKNKPARITTLVTLLTALSTGGYQAYGSLNTALSAYAKKEDITELKFYVENLRREMSLELLNTTIMSYEDELMVVEFEIAYGKATPIILSTKKNIDRRMEDLKQRRKIIRFEISSASKKLNM